jgi:ParB family chromosome partitioning protein
MTIETVPLSSLQPPRNNPRTAIDPVLLEGLAASIRQDNLLQNLVVTKEKRGALRIVSGERRYRALLVLKDRGEIDGDYPVPVEIREGLTKDDALRIATVENLQREDLPPLDQAGALASLIRKGTTLDDIVARTGLSASTIKRRLALNTLCEEAKEQLRNGLLTLAQAEALTLGSHDLQRDMLERIAHSPDDYGASALRDCLLEAKPNKAMATFPLERYTGTFTTDLFQAAEESYFDDAEQFMALQQQAVEELARSYADKAAWVEVTGSYRLPEWQYEKATKRNRKEAGVVINLSPSGAVEIGEGLIRPQEIDEDTADETADPPRARPKPKDAYPAPLRQYVAWHKTVAVQEVLLAHPRKAKEILAVDLLLNLRPHQAIRQFAEHAQPQISFSVIDTQAGLVARNLGLDPGDATGVRALESDHIDDVDAYAMVKALSDEDLDRLFVLLAVLPFGQLFCERLDSGESLFNAVARDLKVDMRNHWRPDGEFFNRRTRQQLVAIAGECGFADGVSAIHSWKKGELVNALLRHFELARSASEPTPSQRKALEWLPGAMQFPAIDPDAVVAADDDGDDADGTHED